MRLNMIRVTKYIIDWEVDDDDVDGVDRCKLLVSIEAICYGVRFTWQDLEN